MKVNLKGIMPTALIFVGVAGVVGTCIACSKDTIKAQEELKKLEAEGVKFETKRDKVKSLWTCYIPTMVTGGFTIISISLAGYLNHKTEMALAAALALNKDNLKKFEKKAREIVGEEKVREIKKEVSKEDAKANASKMPSKDIPDGLVRLYDPFTEQFIDTSIEKISMAKLAMNEDLTRNGEASYNKLIRILGGKIDDTEEGRKLGWCLENEVQDYNWSYERGLNAWIEIYTSELTVDGAEVLTLCFNVNPEIQVPEAMLSYDGNHKIHSYVSSL